MFTVKSQDKNGYYFIIVPDDDAEPDKKLLKDINGIQVNNIKTIYGHYTSPLIFFKTIDNKLIDVNPLPTFVLKM